MSDEPVFDVFLSHNSGDKPAVEYVASQLYAAGLRPFLDKWHLMPGKPWQTELAQALDSSACVAIFFGPSGGGAWHNQEMQVALNKAVRTRDDYRVIPVLLPGAQPSQVNRFLELRTWVDLSRGLDDQVALRRLISAIKGVPPDSAEGLAELPEEPRPYRGLERFESAQAELFFGRDVEIVRLLERLENDRFVAVVGASGSGKSSFVRAGLSTEAAEIHQPGIRKWLRIVVIPGSDPLRAVADEIRRVADELDKPREPRDPTEWVDKQVERFRERSDGLRTLLSTTFGDESNPVLLVVDQLEEVFTHKPTDADEARNATICFAANLRATYEARLDWLRILVTLRSDFLHHFVSEDFPDFRELLEQRQFWLVGMSENDLREAIVRPAKRCGAFFERGLVAMILRDMRGQEAALPLLEEALATLWDERRGPWLMLDVYLRSGGVGGALAAKADNIYERLTDSDKRIAQRVFLELVQLGDGTHDTRRRAPVSALRAAADDPDDVDRILEQFSSAGNRLIALTSDRMRPQENAEITHEALIYHWKKLHDWLDDNRDDLRLQRRVDEQARRWKEAGQPQGLLWRLPDLDLLRQLAHESDVSLTDLQIDFFQFSDQAEKDRLAEKARQQKVLWRRSVAIMVTLGLLFAVALVGLFREWSQAADRRSARARELLERGTQLLDDGNPLGLFELLAAYDTTEKGDTHHGLSEYLLDAWSSSLDGVLQNVYGHDGLVRAVAVNPSGEHYATGSQAGQIRLWTAQGRLVWESNHDTERTYSLGLAFSPDGRRLLASSDRTVRIWDVPSGRPRFTASGHPGVFLGDASVAFVQAVSQGAVLKTWNMTTDEVIDRSDEQCGPPMASSQDGRYLAVRQGRGMVRVWRTSDWVSVAEATHTDEVDAVDFSPDGTVFATASWDQTARLWSTASGEQIGRDLKHREDVRDVSFSLDGNLVATASLDGRVRVWDVASCDLKMVTPQGAPVEFVRFQPPESRLLAAVHRDNTVRMWAVTDGAQEGWQLRHQARITSLAFTPNGHSLLTGSADGTARRWNLVRPPSTTLPHRNRVWSVDFSADSQRLATLSERGEVVIWQLSNGRWIEEQRPPSSDVQTLALAFSPQEDLLAFGSDWDCKVWDVKKQQFLTTIKLQEGDHVRSLAFSSDGKLIAAGTDVRRAWLINLQEENSPSPLEHPEIEARYKSVWDVKFHPKKPWLATAYEDGIVRIWSTRTHQILDEFTHEGSVDALAFNPDGTLLATAVKNNQIWLWRADGTHWDEDRHLKQIVGDVEDLSFSPDGRLLATAANNGEVRIWDVKTGFPCGRAYDASPYAVAVRFSPDGLWLAAGSFGNTAHVWNCPSKAVNMPFKDRQDQVSLLTGAHVRDSLDKALSWEEWREKLAEIRTQGSR